MDDVLECYLAIDGIDGIEKIEPLDRTFPMVDRLGRSITYIRVSVTDLARE